MQKEIQKLSKLISNAKLNKNYALLKAYSELSTFLGEVQKKNTKEARDFKFVLKSALTPVIGNATPDAENIENMTKALKTAWELKQRIAKGRVQKGKEKIRDAFFISQHNQKVAIKKGACLSLEDIIRLNKNMVDLLVDVYGEDRNTLPMFESQKQKAQSRKKEKTKDSLEFIGGLNKLLESLSTPDGIVNFIVPLIGKVIDGIFSLFGGKRKTDPIATEVKSAVKASFTEALRQCKAGPEAHNQETVLMPYFNLVQKASKTCFPNVEKVIQNASALRP